ncbi:hypothetical protein GYMLUDRAFT_504090 [Collybiopsis luxurians FD-317 M1]|uniref:Uncharacterized protein n=1 Tax=Collybiopsis luxurians FD-317 M1 TaxID=944289 RepID=A0A0D0BFE2_9AGAR|nr:hypothetical protein GYMLUDRAFT_504090 [Collybiopsis luxurians FD-317 M1]
MAMRLFRRGKILECPPVVYASLSCCCRELQLQGTCMDIVLPVAVECMRPGCALSSRSRLRYSTVTRQIHTRADIIDRIMIQPRCNAL